MPASDSVSSGLFHYRTCMVMEVQEVDISRFRMWPAARPRLLGSSPEAMINDSNRCCDGGLKKFHPVLKGALLRPAILSVHLPLAVLAFGACICVLLEYRCPKSCMPDNTAAKSVPFGLPDSHGFSTTWGSPRRPDRVNDLHPRRLYLSRSPLVRRT